MKRFRIRLSPSRIISRCSIENCWSLSLFYTQVTMYKQTVNNKAKLQICTKVNKIKSEECIEAASISVKHALKRYFNSFKRIEFGVIVSNVFIAMQLFSCLMKVEFGPSRSGLFYGFKIYLPSPSPVRKHMFGNLCSDYITVLPFFCISLLDLANLSKTGS